MKSIYILNFDWGRAPFYHEACSKFYRLLKFATQIAEVGYAKNSFKCFEDESDVLLINMSGEVRHAQIVDTVGDKVEYHLKESR